ncbi:hypothetical protein BHAMNSH16_09995 [Brachyspira hampsonii]|uniref:Uncharacterized protein n=2 Tax=Brachyspira hampsonii TaxID=1287055 RepID=A0AAC9XKL2_9SPIR|nr:hypothetical protein [Brachyspira hampsonii]ASJ21942.1 hypothetical protein BHAMNSH16_09995 [Brachyspira hampsonii]MBW5380355.1 hypothetical protein [Brachyspira hampsonii]OEJ19507.1 hypothetical protein A9496_03700 [Brachyspira hampsonii]
MEKEKKKIMVISGSIFSIIIVIPLTLVIYNLKLENASYLPNTFSKYAVSFLIAFIIIHLISVIFNKLILLVLTLIAAILIKKIVKYEEDE